MNSSSASAAPLELDLRPGRLESALGGLALLLAIASLLLVALPPWLRIALGALALLVLSREARRAHRRPRALRLHADGSAQSASADGDWQPATLDQAGWYLGLPHLQLRTADGAAHACLLLPDRIDGDARQRLRVWLQTHAPAPAQGAAA